MELTVGQVSGIINFGVAIGKYSLGNMQDEELTHL